MLRLTCLTAIAVLLAIGAAPASGQSVQLAPFGGQTFDSPYYVTGAPGDPSRVFVVEGGGRIRLVKDGVTLGGAFLDISADVFDASEGCGGECGMFSMALAPDYSSSGLFYVFYTHDRPSGNHDLRIEEFRRSAANPDVADPGSRRIVLEIPHPTAANHNGGQLQFGPDGLLYLSTGDGGNTPQNGQSATTLLGKILRIDPPGGGPGVYSIPNDNPFRDGAGPLADEIYSYGLRNPYRFSFDRSTGDLTIGDVGQAAWEEIDFEPEGSGRGANFGWSCFEGPEVFSGCSPPGYSPPVFWYPNPPSGAAAISGGYVIRDSALPTLAGRYIYADTYAGDVRTVLLAPGGATGDASLGLPSVPLLVSFGQDACGHLYVASAGTGTVYRLQPTSGGFPCKTAPNLSVDSKSARRAARKGAIVVTGLCDEDCALSGAAFIALRGSSATTKRGKRTGPRIRARGAALRAQLGVQTKLRLELSAKKTRRLRKALASDRGAVATIEVSATGGGGGTATVRRRIKQKR